MSSTSCSAAPACTIITVNECAWMRHLKPSMSVPALNAAITVSRRTRRSRVGLATAAGGPLIYTDPQRGQRPVPYSGTSRSMVRDVPIMTSERLAVSRR